MIGLMLNCKNMATYFSRSDVSTPNKVDAYQKWKMVVKLYHH